MLLLRCGPLWLLQKHRTRRQAARVLDRGIGSRLHDDIGRLHRLPDALRDVELEPATVRVQESQTRWFGRHPGQMHNVSHSNGRYDFGVEWPDAHIMCSRCSSAKLACSF